MDAESIGNPLSDLAVLNLILSGQSDLPDPLLRPSLSLTWPIWPRLEISAFLI